MEVTAFAQPHGPTLPDHVMGRSLDISKISFSGFSKPVSKVCKMSFDVFEKKKKKIARNFICVMGTYFRNFPFQDFQNLFPKFLR
jgi:hypothetical protein